MIRLVASCGAQGGPQVHHAVRQKNMKTLDIRNVLPQRIAKNADTLTLSSVAMWTSSL